jgi:ferredoxin
MKKIKYNPSKCIGCSTCVVYDPEHFNMNDEDGKAALIKATCADDECILETTDDLTETKNAAESCPTNAFAVEE